MALKSTAQEFWAASPSGRLAALDVGTKTIGVAFSDSGRMLASCGPVIPRTSWKITGPQVCALLIQQEVTGLVVGWPLHMDGQISARCHATRHFVENLEKLREWPTILWDERLSTVAAERFLRDDADLSRQKRAKVVDALAACFILQSFLMTAGRC